MLRFNKDIINIHPVFKKFDVKHRFVKNIVQIHRFLIIVEGRVQGVGFRPFVYKLANSLDLKGFVKNTSQGIFVDIQGKSVSANKFLQSLKDELPPLAYIEKITVKECKTKKYKNFSIIESETIEKQITLVSPDFAICNDCTEDIRNPNNRRYKYAFTNCTNCGPRFSIIKDFPYDRKQTTMNKFNLCEDCSKEYTNPLNRRFHAEPNACKFCGPKLWIMNSSGIITNIDNPIEYTIRKLNEGSIIAIKGLCGFHLICNAENTNAIKELRNRKKRPLKPLAVMMKDINIVKKYCYVNSVEEALLIGNRKPIVILNCKSNSKLPEILAPEQKTIGVMLPYTPLHVLLFSQGVDVLVMTSANVQGLPLEYINKNTFKNLNTIADYFLMHDREIYIPVDDSVFKVMNNEPRILRRARGYTPEPLKYNITNEILACGSNMKNTFCISKDNYLFLSQHNGDLENLETYKHYLKNIEHFKHLFKFEPKYLAFDMHPGYITNYYIAQYNIPKIEIQHHHAHIASCMIENNIESKVIGVAFDGTGYGIDKNLWGGEFLICDLQNFSRVAHLNYISMPGGEKAIKEPWRMAVSYLYKSLSKFTSENELNNIVKNLYEDKGLTILNIIKSKINSPMTSSIGRLFDAVSSLIGINHITSYEGQAAIELESAIDIQCIESYRYSLSKGIPYLIDTDELILEILNDKLNKVSISKISLKFHNTIVSITVDVCCLLRKKFNLNNVALSGGVFQNSYLLTRTINELEKNNFKVYSHRLFPTNDGGIALGQLAIANSIIKNSK